MRSDEYRRHDATDLARLVRTKQVTAAGERLLQVGLQVAIGALHRARTGDQDVVVALPYLVGGQRCGERARGGRRAGALAG